MERAAGERRARLGQGAALQRSLLLAQSPGPLPRHRHAFVEANPTKAEGLKDLASLMMADGEFEMAQEVLDRATAIAPDLKVVAMASGLNAFRIGQFKRGLDLYAARWSRNTHDKPWDIPVPDWDGKPLDGHLIVYCEQGIGDYAMFSLLFPELRRYAKAITIEVNSRIASLFRRSFPDMPIVDRNALAGRLGSQPLPRQGRHGRPAVAAAGRDREPAEPEWPSHPRAGAWR